MTTNTTLDIETRIIEAANKVFLKYGVDGATMLQIAEEAGISRTSLHYYFRSKALLFEKVLGTIQSKFIPTLFGIIDTDVPVLLKIQMFVDRYIDLIISNPMIPGFLLIEIQRNANWVIDVFKTKNLNIDKLNAQIRREVAEGKINPFKLEDLFANVLGMSVFPAISKPVFMEFVFKDEEEFHEFMISRKKEIMLVIESWLTPI